MAKPKFPMVIKEGHTRVKIYLTPTKGCDSFTVVHYLGKERHRKTFADLELAVTDARSKAAALSRGELNVLTLKNEDQLIHVRAVEAAKPTGLPLDVLAMNYAEMHRLLAGRTTPLEVIRDFVKQNPICRPKKLLSKAVEELVLAKEADRMSHVYVKDLKDRLKRFVNEVGGNINDITVAGIESFLRGLKTEEKPVRPLSGRSRNNYRRAIATLIYFAEARGYLTKNSVDVESVAKAREDEGDIEIFTPEEMGRVLAAADEMNSDLIPFLAIGAFAGLRHAEIQRLDWSEVKLADGFIEVKASKAKTASRRLVPITENLSAWLTPHKKANGLVCPLVSMTNQFLKLAVMVTEKWQQEKPAGTFQWRHNALRHSFISYRVAQVQNVAQVALEAGNSSQMVFSNYRELVRPTDAEKWFGIRPCDEGKVIGLQQGSEQDTNSVARGVAKQSC